MSLTKQYFKYVSQNIFGLPGLLQTLGCQGRTRPLTIFGPAEGMEPVWGAIRTLTGPQPYAIRAVPLGTDPVRLETLAPGWPVGAELLPFRTKHRVPSRGYRLDLPRAGRFDPARARVLGVPVQQWRSLQRGEPVTLEDGTAIAPGQVLGAPRRGLRFVFSGDTAPCAALEQAAQDADLLLCDATYPDDAQQAQAKQYGHSTFRQDAELAARAGALFAHHHRPGSSPPGGGRGLPGGGMRRGRTTDHFAIRRGTFMTAETISFPLDPGAAALLTRLHAAGHAAYAVGGCVRDSLLGQTPHDWDLCTSATPEQVLELFGKAHCIPTGLQHGTVTVKHGGELYEITTFRTEGAYSDGRHPDHVAFVPDVKEDLARRDFTINAMAYNAEEGLIDPFGGSDLCPS